MQTNHTPGPWHYDNEEFAILAPSENTHFYQIIADLADIFHEESGQCDPQETIANGQLIAAAPDLLESLQWYVNSRPTPQNPSEGYLNAIKAIRKAKGI